VEGRSQRSSVTREYTAAVPASARLVAAHLTFALVAGACNTAPPAPQQSTAAADLFIVNGHVYTSDDSGTVAEAVAVSGNTILRIGKTEELSALRGAHTGVIDAHRGTG